MGPGPGVVHCGPGGSMKPPSDGFPLPKCVLVMGGLGPWPVG